MYALKFTANNNKELDENFVNSRINNFYNNTMVCNHKSSFGPISVEEVVNLVKTIKSISSGIDNINISTINLFLSRISVILTHIINISFELNSFPERWKKLWLVRRYITEMMCANFYVRELFFVKTEINLGTKNIGGHINFLDIK